MLPTNATEIAELLEDLDCESYDLAETVHDQFTQLANNVNDHGLIAQVQCLLDSDWKPAEIVKKALTGG